MKKLYFLFFLFLTTTGAMRAQDIHFSQFYASPLTLNPAMAGVMNGNIRLAAIYRNQWTAFAPFKTVHGSFDINFNPRFIPNDLLGVGISFFNDQAGDADFSTNQGNISLSYIKSLGGVFSASNYLSAGIQAGFAQRSINYAALTFGSQFDGIDYDPNQASGEILSNDNFSFIDLSAGIFWFYLPDTRKSVYSGVSFHHINRPDQTFFDGDQESLFMKTSFSLGGQFPITDNTDLNPGFLMHLQGPFKEFVAGTNVKFLIGKKIHNQNTFAVGVWQRLVGDVEKTLATDATIITTRFDMNSLSVGFSYDINVSSLRDASNGNGGPEISLIYVTKYSKRIKSIDCPEF